ncbi:phenylalanine--tRNA ligase subunit beta [Arsenicicoccus piscis]|uniref:Phenylalanine--tRNA ligase beta subunit n=1 Tax=Arsenicicoccus piscis TaxID=673954 RepID=A0ABQ6HLP2_9MICO|nr:phenylalanine--tRNA ligase beta subunit [Arsenicicoccus piscis]
MRAPVSWLRELVDVDPAARGEQIAAALVRVGLEEEGLHGGDITGPLVVGRVLDFVDEPQKNGKVIRWCTVDVGDNGQRLTEGKPQEIVCGASNFAVGDLVVVVLPGATLPGGFQISARKTYGHVSNGMICAEDELGLGEDHSGIIVLTDYLADQPELLARAVPGADAIELLGLGDEVVEVNVTPDRGYCFSMRGIAREYSHATGVDFVDPVDALRDAAPVLSHGGYPVRLEDDAPIHDVAGCDRYVARIVRGVDVSASSPSWMQTRLTQLGMRPISLAVDVTNYVMLLLGQPMHAFDLAKLGDEIVVRRARAGERLTTLDDVTRTLDPEDLLITDGERPLVIAGVFGGADCEVDETTTDVLLEAAHFDPVSIARSARRHKLATEASKRFERGVDPLLAPAAMQLAVDLLVTYGGGVADPAVTDVGEPVLPAPFTLDPQLPARLVGIDLGEQEVHDALLLIGAQVDQDPHTEPVSAGTDAAGSDPDETVTDQPHTWTVTPPSWRPDLTNGPDVAEEVARLRGYDQIPSVLPQAPGGRGLTAAQRDRRRVADTLAQQGLVEVLTYPFVGEGSDDALGLPAEDARRRHVRLANPINDQEPLLRTSLLSTLANALRLNVSRGAKDVGVYELGVVFRPRGEGLRAPVPPLGQRPSAETLAEIDAAVPDQPHRVAFLRSGDAEARGPWAAARPVDAGDAVALALAVAAALGVELDVVQDEHAPFHPGRCVRLETTDGRLVGHAGELHPRVLKALELPARVVGAELDLDVLSAVGDSTVVQATKLSTLPVAHTDVALVVDASVPAADVARSLRAGAGTSWRGSSCSTSTAASSWATAGSPRSPSPTASPSARSSAPSRPPRSRPCATGPSPRPRPPPVRCSAEPEHA